MVLMCGQESSAKSVNVTVDCSGLESLGILGRLLMNLIGFYVTLLKRIGVGEQSVGVVAL